MNKEEAQKLLVAELSHYRAKSYAELVEKFGCWGTVTRIGAAGDTYQIQVDSFWDDQPNEDLRVVASIDDGGIRAFAPLSDSFIISPAGLFIGE